MKQFSTLKSLRIALLSGFLAGCAMDQTRRASEPQSSPTSKHPSLIAEDEAFTIPELLPDLQSSLKAFQAALASGSLRLFNDDLLEAVARCDVGKVRGLVKAGHDVNVEDGEGNTALILAAHGDSRIGALTLKGSKITEAMYRSEENLKYIECVRLLLEHGANRNHETSLGNTALNTAMSSGQAEIEYILRFAGATNEGKWIGRRE